MRFDAFSSWKSAIKYITEGSVLSSRSQAHSSLPGVTLSTRVTGLFPVTRVRMMHMAHQLLRNSIADLWNVWIRKCKHCHCQGCHTHTHTHVQLVYVFLIYSNMFKLLQLAVSMIAFSCLSISQKQIMGSRAWHGVIWKRKTKLKRKDRKYSPLANSVLLAEEKLRGGALISMYLFKQAAGFSLFLQSNMSLKYHLNTKDVSVRSFSSCVPPG